MVVVFTRARPGCRWVHPKVLGVVGYILGRGIHLCTLFRSLGSSGVVGFTRVHRSCLWSLLSRGLGVVELISGLSVHSCAPWVSLVSYGAIVARPVVVGTIRGGWVHLDALWGSLSSSWVVGFTLARSGHNSNVRVFTRYIYI